MEVWKEFFRLKWEEIKHWIGTPDSIFPILILFVILAGIGSSLIATKHIVWGLIFILIPAIFFMIGVYFMVSAPIKWIISNWQQAKINVENRK